MQRAYLDVSDLARSYNELSMVEDYLLQCGRLGYAGPEMFQAVELRQQLVALAVNKKRRSVLVDLPTIKFKALICNLLISREVDALKQKMVALNSESPKSDMLHTPECIAVDTMLSEHYTTMNLVNSAIKSKSVDAIDAALAQAAYHFFYAENVTAAVTVLNETCNNPTILLRPLVEALRAGDVSHIEGTFKMISAVGWTHPAAQAVVVNKIHDRQNKIVQVWHMLSVTFLLSAKTFLVNAVAFNKKAFAVLYLFCSFQLECWCPFKEFLLFVPVLFSCMCTSISHHIGSFFLFDFFDRMRW